MQDNLQTSILTDCIDQMAIIPYLATFGERYHFTQELTEILSNYPPSSDQDDKRSHTYAQIAEHMGRSLRSVANKISNMRMASMVEDNYLAIEDGVKMRQSKAAMYRAMLSRLEVGQSFVFPYNERAIVSLQRSLFKDLLFRAQRVDEHSMRLWRIG